MPLFPFSMWHAAFFFPQFAVLALSFSVNVSWPFSSLASSLTVWFWKPMSFGDPQCDSLRHRPLFPLFLNLSFFPTIPVLSASAVLRWRRTVFPSLGPRHPIAPRLQFAHAFLLPLSFFCSLWADVRRKLFSTPLSHGLHWSPMLVATRTPLFLPSYGFFLGVSRKVFSLWQDGKIFFCGSCGSPALFLSTPPEFNFLPLSAGYSSAFRQWSNPQPLCPRFGIWSGHQHLQAAQPTFLIILTIRLPPPIQFASARFSCFSASFRGLFPLR